VLAVALSFNASRLSASWAAHARLVRPRGREPRHPGSLRNSLIVGAIATPRRRPRPRRRRSSTTASAAGRARGAADAADVAPEIVLAASMLLVFAALGLRLGFDP
jgi:ABC-type spermidine/putrescine transport system permease subunit II